MTGDPLPAFEIVTYQFRLRGILIRALPGEYSVNYLNGKPETAQHRETLREAIELAEEMAQAAPAAVALQKAAYRQKRRLSMRSKAIIKRHLKGHNRGLRATALKAQRETTLEGIDTRLLRAGPPSSTR